MKQTKPASSDIRQSNSNNVIYRICAVIFALTSLLPLLWLWIVFSAALDDSKSKQEYKTNARSTIARVEIYERKTKKYGRQESSWDDIVVRYTDSGNSFTSRLNKMSGLPPAEGDTWVGREIEILYLPERANSALLASDLDRLPDWTDSVAHILGGFAMLAMLLYATVSLWRKGATKAG